ncbi:acyl-CoA dehydrogenase family protein, partial [Parafrankia sp. FMc2]|uniref:acyl-CoA dehydrogenase family protein n=1 Tax=Parafrankia sp. FMc2 TaxID=3233196 RepID=UPI0034D3AA1D
MRESEFAEVLAAVRAFVRERVVPAEAAIEENDAIPECLRAEAARRGLFGFALPEQYGDLGLSMSEEVRLVGELGYTTPSFRSMFGTNNGIAGHVLEQWLRPVDRLGGRTFPVIEVEVSVRPTLARRSGRHARAHGST